MFSHKQNDFGVKTTKKGNMLIKSVENKPTFLAWPSGEWSESLLKAVILAGIVVEGKSERNYVFSLPALNIVANICRATDIPLAVQKVTSRAVAGITGSDILQEYNLSSPDSLNNRQYYRIESMPIEDLVPSAPEPSLRWGTTPNTIQKFGKQYEWTQLASGVVFTSYPRLAQQSLREKINVELPIIDNSSQSGEVDPARARIEFAPGKVEGLWRLYPYNYLIADVVEKGETAKANGIKLLDQPILSPIFLQMLIALEKVSSADWERLQLLVKLIAEANYLNSDRW